LKKKLSFVNLCQIASKNKELSNNISKTMNKSIRLSNLLNDCITLVHEAGTHVKSTAQKSTTSRMGGSSAYDTSKTSKVSRESI
jgi:hypothetical protein